LAREIKRRGPGDYIAVTSTYDLYKLKFLPALREVFEQVLGIGRYWSGLRVMEIADPETGRFHATRGDDIMWARVILRSADSKSGLESATAKAAILDEVGQNQFDLPAWRAVQRRLHLHHGRIAMATTLYDVGWVDSEILDRANKGGEKQVTEIRGATLEVTDNPDTDILLLQYDSILNPTFPLAEYEAARDSMPDDEFNAFYRGRRVQSRLMIYDCFSRPRNTG